MDVDARLEAGHSTEKNVILVLGPLLPALVGSINSFPDFFAALPEKPVWRSGLILRSTKSQSTQPSGSQKLMAAASYARQVARLRRASADIVASTTSEVEFAAQSDLSDENWNPTGSSSGLHRFTLHSDNPQLPASLQNGQDRFELY
jgi:hypothetical protein